MPRPKPTASRVEIAEHQARAKYLRARLIPNTRLAISDAALYPTKGSAGLRAAAEKALEVEIEASLALAELLKGKS
jgi:hypothetical protein